MRFLIQRVGKASVKVDDKIVGKIGKGFLVLVGITHEDTREIADLMVRKLLKLRVFSDENDNMNLALHDIDGELLLISQFTLYANCKHGNRPDFLNAAKPEYAKDIYEYVVESCKNDGIIVQEGIFGADMKVELLNDGPVTIILDSDEL